jgi:hypothetical protein
MGLDTLIPYTTQKFRDTIDSSNSRFLFQQVDDYRCTVPHNV